jgi:hypothetical protein
LSWEVAGTIAEVIGAVAVVLSLLYLAAQIRQNTNAAKAGTSVLYRDNPGFRTFVDSLENGWLGRPELYHRIRNVELARAANPYARRSSDNV